MSNEDDLIAEIFSDLDHAIKRQDNSQQITQDEEQKLHDQLEKFIDERRIDSSVFKDKWLDPQVKKILIVDDSKLIHNIVQKIVADYDVVCHAVNNGQEAVDCIDTFDGFDLITLDIMMPLLTGIEFLEIMAKRKISIPTIILSTENEKSLIAKGLCLGAKSYVTKPFKDEVLFQKISEVFEKQGKPMIPRDGGSLAG